jgi:YD repeat-containing protein
MRSPRPAYASLTRFACVVLSYSLLLSFLAPLRLRAAAPPQPQGHTANGRAARRDGELIVRFRQEVSEQEKEELAASRGVRRGRRVRGESRLDKLTLPAGRDLDALASELRLNPAVEFAEPNYLIKRNELTPDDPRFGEQWSLKNTGGAGAQAGSDINATPAWEVTTGAASTVVAVIDSGVDFTHPDLRGNQWTNSKETENGQDDDGDGLADDLHGWDWVAASNAIRDEQGHGTVIAGLIAAQGNNAVGISGVMWRASVMSLRVLDETGTGDVANAVEAIDYAVAHGARVINCSWGMDEPSESLRDAISRAARRGVLFVCSAGNDGRNIDGTPYYPASFELENLISVASTDNSDQLTTWSNWGTARVHVGAPGEKILSTKMGGGYKSVSGSSASAPLVAGVAGLLKTLRPHLSAKRTRELILAGVRPVETLTGKVSSGGVVSAAGALGALNGLSPDEGKKKGDENRDGNDGDHPNGNNGNNGNGNGGNANGGHRPEKPVVRTQGAPGANLPNLDEARKSRHTTPGAPAPIRSNLPPTCDPGDPECDPLPTPTPTPAPPSASPVGWLDSIGSDGTAAGWVFDPDASAQSIDAHFYIDGPSGSGQWAGGVTANVARPDVNQAYGVTGNHGFSFSIPPRFRNGQPHTLYVYGIDATGNPNTLLSASPKSFTLNASGTITATPNPIQVCDGTGLGVTTLSWSTGGTSEVDVRVGAPNGALFATTGSTGSGATGKWVANGTVFYLQNASYGDRTSAANTLATVTVGVTTGGCAVSCSSAGPDNTTVAYNAATHDVFAYGVQNAANVSFAVWGTANGQNDIIWYQGQNQGGGTWKATINFANHPETGQFNTHVYMQGSAVFCDWADFTRAAAPTPTPTPATGASAAFVKLDTTTQGNWKGTYGADGFALVGEPGHYPAYVQLTNIGGAAYTWADPATDVRALQKSPAGSTERIAATLYSSTEFGWNINLTDGQEHQFAMYALDWDANNARAQKVEIRDAATGALLDSRDMSAYSNGQYVVWNLRGNVTVKAIYTGPAGINAVAAALFFDAVAPAQNSPVNVALAANGGTATASSVYPEGNYAAASTINGDRKGLNWGAGGGWNDATVDDLPDWLQVDFNGAKSINEIDVFTLQDNYANPSEPTEAMTFNQWGLTYYEVQYWTGTAWATVPGGSVVGNIKVWRKFTFPALTTQKIRVLASGGANSYSRLTEVEAYQAGQGGGGSAPSDPTGNNFSVARLDAANRTGQPGTDLFSGNYNWGIPLAGLRGRAGLDLAVSLSYNSLVWTRDNSAIKYDADRGTPSAGFRLGFPAIESRFYNPATNKNAYLMITPAGERVELRQVGASNVYEAANSSYLQLVDNGGALTLRTTDGTQLSYLLSGNAYRCTQIKDRNGNYMSVSYYGHGGIQTITDTLGRAVNFNYDGNQRPISITQTWNNATHTWATFGYSDIFVQPNFSGLAAVLGPQNQSVSLLTQVGLDDGSRYNFDYAPSGQVSVIRHYAADNHQLSYTAYDFSASGTDCPRVVGRRDFAEDWNNGAEALTTYADEGGGVRAVTMPDRATVYKEFFATTGWQRGLTTRTENWSGSLQKWTTTQWTQDDTTLGYQLNPRPNDASVYDIAGNRRRTTVDYTSYGLPENVREWGGANGDQLLRRSRTYYNLDAAFVNRRIIGLAAARLVYEGESTLVAKSEFHYDWGGEYFPAQTPSVQHDGVSYGASFLTGRGNLSAVRRFNRNAPDDAQQAVWQQITGYNAAGLPVFIRDADGHAAQLSYADAFSDGNNSRNTLAYPTQATDADGYSSTSRYNYDMGVATRLQNPKGMVVGTTYDGAGRVERVTNETSGAYTRFVYPTGNNYVQSFSTIQTGVESYSINIFDGAGRVRASATGHPGSAGGYSGQFIKYDVMGRATARTNAAEITAGWLPAGDDAAGWVWSNQAYDWKGRPTITTNADLTTKEASYGGCGCAGGEVVTLRDEIGRRQRTTSDVLGRPVKTEDLNADTSVYRTTTNTYNALDQVTRVYVQAGTNGAGQETLMTYDGFGRLSTQKAPIQTSATVYTYNADDTVRTVTDARGAVRTMSYNARHLLTGVSYSAPTGITPTGATAYDYDAAGNRLWMADDSGRVDYTYNALSQLTNETRQFAGLSGSYALNYTYNLAGQVQSVTDPAGAVVNYGYDAEGRLNQVTGTPYGGVSQYATGMQYRAFGALKSLNYGNGQALTQGFDARQRLAQLQSGTELSAVFEYHADNYIRYAKDNTDATKDRAYNYDQVGRLAEGLTGAEARGGVEADGIYRQAYQYDAWDNLTGRTVNRFWSVPRPFTNNYVNDRNNESLYDAQGNVTKDTYGVGGRMHTYDAAGQKVKTSEKSKSQGGEILNLTANGAGDVAGVAATPTPAPELAQGDNSGGGGGETNMAPGGYETTTTLTIAQSYDGDGRSTKRVQTKLRTRPFTQDVTTSLVDYYVRSSVLGGQVITELDGAGQKAHTKVYAGSQLVAEQDVYAGGVQGLTWQQTNPITGTEVKQNTVNGLTLKKEYDPFGLELGESDPYLNNPEPDYASLSTTSLYRDGGNPFDGGGGCTWDGVPVNCSTYAYAMNSGYTRMIGQEPGQGRGFNPAGKPNPYESEENYIKGGREMEARFDNAAEYDDSIDSWQSPLWLGDGREFNNGSGRFVLASQTSIPILPDPCAGKKGGLNYDSPRRRPDQYGQTTARGHITYGHIRRDVATDKSKYVASSIISDERKFNIVTGLNQATFRLANGYRDGGSIVYIYAVPEVDMNHTVLPMPFNTKMQPLVGIDSKSGKATNVNTLVIKSDCSTVITSYPGLPTGVSPGDPRISGTAKFFNLRSTVGPLIP